MRRCSTPLVKMKWDTISPGRRTNVWQQFVLLRVETQAPSNIAGGWGVQIGRDFVGRQVSNIYVIIWMCPSNLILKFTLMVLEMICPWEIIRVRWAQEGEAPVMALLALCEEGERLELVYLLCLSMQQFLPCYERYDAARRSWSDTEHIAPPSYGLPSL
jgi:hypothetical protein